MEVKTVVLVTISPLLPSHAGPVCNPEGGREDWRACGLGFSHWPLSAGRLTVGVAGLSQAGPGAPLLSLSNWLESPLLSSAT